MVPTSTFVRLGPQSMTPDHKMAKSGKQTFRDSAADFERIRKDILDGRIAPIYLLTGDEEYFIDSLADVLTERVLPADQVAFNRIITYGKDASEADIINFARQMPMMGNRLLIIVREAQGLKRLEQLSLYTANPCPTTTLVICHKVLKPKGKAIDKRIAFYKQCASSGVVFESVAPRDYEIGPWLAGFIRSKGCEIDADAMQILLDHLGTEITKISNEITKLLTYLPEGTSRITSAHIETNIGISKDFNNFELTKAISTGDRAKAMLIADHFRRNAKDNPPTRTIDVLFDHFRRIFILNYKRWQVRYRNIPMPSDDQMCTMMKLPNPYFLNEYKQAAALYPNKKVFAILGLLRDYDLKFKGMDNGSADNGELMEELLLRIFMM